jgi:hypothetical protein
MDQPIISREMIRACARTDFVRGVGRDEHNMNPGAAAIEVWQAEWDICESFIKLGMMRDLSKAIKAMGAQLRHMLVEVSPP